jgi:choline dehydrogenase-like flavoprotein
MPGGAAPLVTYRHSGEDWRRLSKGVGRLGQALLRTGATHVFPSIGNHPGWTYEAETEPYIDRPRKLRGAKLISIHLFGSCPLGTDESICVADSFGRVHNAENLYIADASIIPEAPGVNPQATVMALARRNALHILETSK